MTLKTSKERLKKLVKTIEAIEVSLTATQKDVDEFKKQMQDPKTQLTDNKKHIASLETQIDRDKQKIQNLTRKALEEEALKSNIATMVEI